MVQEFLDDLIEVAFKIEVNEKSGAPSALRGIDRQGVRNRNDILLHRLCDMPFLPQAPPCSGCIWKIRSEMTRYK